LDTPDHLKALAYTHKARLYPIDIAHKRAKAEIPANLNFTQFSVQDVEYFINQPMVYNFVLFLFLLTITILKIYYNKFDHLIIPNHVQG